MLDPNASALCQHHWAMSPHQPAPIGAAMEKTGQRASILVATGNDAGGQELAEQIEAIVREAGCPDLRIVRALPAGEGEDWNDRLWAAARTRELGNTHAPGPRPAT